MNTNQGFHNIENSGKRDRMSSESL